MQLIQRIISACLVVGLGTSLAVQTSAQATPLPYYKGFNLPQATFGGDKIPGVPNKDYMWQNAKDIDLYAADGANIFRVGFLWERMQPTLFGPLNMSELSKLDALVDEAAARKSVVLIDVHNFGNYHGAPIGAANVPNAAFQDLWVKLAAHYKSERAVAFGLMNEPVKQSADQWAETAQGAIDAIRSTGARQPIFVPGTGWDGAHSWNSKFGDHSNAQALAGITDPSHNLIFEVHEYFDQDSSGSHSNCVSFDIGVKRLAEFTTWLRSEGQRGFLGEFGASKEPDCVDALQATLKFIASNKDVWVGWTYWAAAPWFGDYMFNVYPPDESKFPQYVVLKSALHD